MDDKKIIRHCSTFACQECANYSDHCCLPEDGPCHVINPNYPTIREGAIDCDYFLTAVLPSNSELHKLVWNELLSTDIFDHKDTRNCILCGRPYVPASPRQKYCAVCGDTMKAQRNRDKQRRHNEKKRKRMDTDVSS